MFAHPVGVAEVSGSKFTLMVGAIAVAVSPQLIHGLTGWRRRGGWGPLPLLSVHKCDMD